MSPTAIQVLAWLVMFFFVLWLPLIAAFLVQTFGERRERSGYRKSHHL